MDLDFSQSVQSIFPGHRDDLGKRERDPNERLDLLGPSGKEAFFPLKESPSLQSGVNPEVTVAIF